jgi:hypothetical protein
MIKLDVFSQVDGNVFMEGEDGAETMVSKTDTMQLLIVVLNAIRIEGDTEKMSACAKSCMAMLGVARFR